MTIYNPENLNSLVSYHKEKLNLVFHEAGNEIDTLYMSTWHLYNAAEKSMLRSCHLRNCAKRIFEGEIGVSWKDRNGIGFKLYFDGMPLGIECLAELKLKKLNQNLISSNIATRAVRLFNNQQAAYRPIAVQASLFGDHQIIEEPAHLIAGYTRNPLDTSYERLAITYPTGMRSAELVLELSAAVDFSSIFQIPLAEINEAAPRTRVRRKTQSNIEQQELNLNRIIQQTDEGASENNVVEIRSRKKQ